MNAYTKVAQAVIRVVAFGLIVISFFLCAADLYLMLSEQRHPQWLIVKAVPFMIGLILFFASGALARRLTKDLD